MILRIITTIACLAVFTQIASAQEVLNEAALFRRCYAHLTQLRPRLENPLLAQVKAGSKTAIQACQEVLNSAKLTADSGTKIGNVNDPVAKSVLRTFHELHRSWAMYQRLFDSGGVGIGATAGAEVWYDDSPLGSYITRALFSDGYNVDSITQGNDFLQPVRVTMSPPPTYIGIPNPTTVFRLTAPEAGIVLPAGFSQPFAPKGDLLGIRTINSTPLKFFPVKSLVYMSGMPDMVNIGVPPAASQPITAINFPTLAAVKGPLTVTDHFAIRITGTLNIPTSGNYTLYLDADDIATLFVDQQRQFDLTTVGEKSVALSLTAGAHPIIVEFRQYGSLARLTLSWKGPGITKQAVPASAFTGLQANYYTQFQAPALNFSGNIGGGILGNFNYFLTNFTQASETFVPDGALATNRSWARAVFSDILCREMPVVREEDVQAFVVANSPTPFRKSAGCVTCHASMDRQAGVIRGLRYNNLQLIDESATSGLQRFGMLGLRMLAPALPEMTTWSDMPDGDYGKRAPFGHFFFRNLHGDPVDQVIHSTEELGAAIRGQDDYYACFAKRYYQYFTGITVRIGDPGAPNFTPLNAADSQHRDKVLWLADRLKNSKSLSQLIMDIIGSDEYRRSDYAIVHKE